MSSSMASPRASLPPQYSPERSAVPMIRAGPSNPRKRFRTACTRCKLRKQKCDDQLPVCSNCLRAGVACDKADITAETVPGAYARALEEEVAILERLVAEKGISRSDIDTQLEHPRDEHVAMSQTTRSQRPTGATASMNGSTPQATETGHQTRSGLENAEDIDLFSVGNFEAPAYIGPSSGLSLAMNLGEIVQATVWNKAIPEANDGDNTSRRMSISGTLNQLASSSGGSCSRRKTISRRPMTMEELSRCSVKEPPSHVLGSRLMDTYFRHHHPLYPFLDPVEMWELHKRRRELTAIPAGSVDMAQRFLIFKLYMVYAIGATFLQLVEKSLPVPPESYYTMALQHVPAAKQCGTIQNIEAMALLVIHHLRSASGHGLWYIVGLAMRSCIGLGLHRRGYENGLTPLQIQWRRRLFWTVYSLERTITISLGRPLSISDRHIDVDLPDPVLPTSSPSAAPPMPYTNGRSPATPLPSESQGGIQAAILLFQLRRIESSIHHSIYRTDRPLADLLPKLDKHLQKVEGWRELLISSFPADSPHLHYPLMHYHRALTLLIQPFLTILPSSDPYYQLCVQAAGKICQTFKMMHQTMYYGHSFAMVQNVFVAGATLVYSLWTHGTQTWSFALADDIRACSSVLFVMSDRAPWVAKYRDAFEVLVDAAMEKLKHGDSYPRDVSTPAGSQVNPVSQEPGAMRDSPGSNLHRVAPTQGCRDACLGVPNPYGPPSAQMLEIPNMGAGEWPEGCNVWRPVMELANWIDPDQEDCLVGMPSFEDLQWISS